MKYITISVGSSDPDIDSIVDQHVRNIIAELSDPDERNYKGVVTVRYPGNVATETHSIEPRRAP